jgi:hypothetical protein
MDMRLSNLRLWPMALVLAASASPAWADIAPEPDLPDDATPTMMIALAALVVAILAIFVFRRLRR